MKKTKRIIICLSVSMLIFFNIFMAVRGQVDPRSHSDFLWYDDFEDGNTTYNQYYCGYTFPSIFASLDSSTSYSGSNSIYFPDGGYSTTTKWYSYPLGASPEIWVGCKVKFTGNFVYDSSNDNYNTGAFQSILEPRFDGQGGRMPTGIISAKQVNGVLYGSIMSFNYTEHTGINSCVVTSKVLAFNQWHNVVLMTKATATTAYVYGWFNSNPLTTPPDAIIEWDKGSNTEIPICNGALIEDNLWGAAQGMYVDDFWVSNSAYNGGIAPTASPVPTTTVTPTASPTPETPSTTDVDAIFRIDSNSTVSEVNFQSKYGILDFNVSGLTGTTGYVNVSMQKTVLPDLNQLRVFMDGEVITTEVIESTNTYQVYFSYGHSSHMIKMMLVQNPTVDFTPLLSVIAILVVTTLTFAFIVRAKLRAS